MESEGSKLEKEGATRQACASCKHQRKKCRRDCMLAPFFPAERTREFQSVHKVFGVSNVQKMIGSLDTERKRSKAAESLIWEAKYREHDPVNGCWEDYKRLEAEVWALRRHVSNCTGSSNSNFEHGHPALKSSYNNSNLNGIGGLNMSVNHMINHRQSDSNMFLLEQKPYPLYIQGNIQGNESVLRAHPPLISLHGHNQDFHFFDQLNSYMKTNGELMDQFNQININGMNHQFIDANPNALDIDFLCNENWEQISKWQEGPTTPQGSRELPL